MVWTKNSSSVIFLAKSAHLFSNFQLLPALAWQAGKKKGEFQKQRELLKFPELSFYHF